MAEGGEKFQSQPKEPAVGAGVSGGGTPRVVEGSLVRPAGHTPRVVEAGRSLVPQRDNGQTGNWFDQEMPYEELVGHIRGAVERARATHPKTAREPFNAAEWLGWQLQKMVWPEREHQKLYMDLRTAWDALAYTRYTAEDGEWRNSVRDELEARVSLAHKTSLILPPQSVKVLDAMAEVAGIPRKRGEATIDLTPFAPKDTGQEP